MTAEANVIELSKRHVPPERQTWQARLAAQAYKHRD
jgi:hypothetical protein